MQLQRRISELENARVDVLVVGYERPEAAERYAADMKLLWPLVMDRASKWDVWGPRTWWAYARHVARGVKPEPSSGDAYQRGGDVLVDPDGIVRLHHVGKGPADRPSVDTILSRARSPRVVLPSARDRQPS